MDIFKDLLENTKGFPAEQLRDIQNTANTLLAIGAMSQFDLQESAQYILDHLPELREERALRVEREAAAEKDPQVRAQLEVEAAMLHKSAKKLSDNPDEQFRRRAALVELSIHLKARLREMSQTAPAIDPVRLKKFKTALSVAATGGWSDEDLPGGKASRVQRELAARLQFLQEFREAGGNADLAVDNFYRCTFADRERGHWADMAAVATVGDNTVEDSLNALKDLATQSPLDDLVDRQNERERNERIAENRLLQAMPRLAAEHLNPKEYAAFRVMLDNAHLLNWKITDGKVHFKANSLDAGDDSNTVGKILMRDLDYRNIRGANLLVQNTVEKLNTILLEHDGKEVAQTEKGRQRMQKATAEILADPAAKAGPAPTAGRPRGGKRKDGPEL